MKKFLLFLLAIITLSCEKNEEFDLQEFLNTFKTERGIKADISITSIYSNNDFEYVAGKKDFELHLYKIENKKIISEHKTLVPKQVTKIENGKTTSYPVTNFTPVIVKSEKEDFVWIDVQRHFAESNKLKSNPYFVIFSFVANGSSFVKIDNSQHKSHESILDIRTWNDTHFLIQSIGNQSDRIYYIYDNQWNFLFESPVKSLWNDKRFYALTHENAIEFFNENQLFQKINIKNNQTEWTINSNEIFGSKEIVTAQVTHLEKSDNIWKFTFTYELRYKNNDREQTESGTKTIKINTENGTIVK